MARPGKKLKDLCPNTVTPRRRKGKVIYPTVQAAETARVETTLGAVLTFETLEVYRCQWGEHWHLGRLHWSQAQERKAALAP